MDVSEVCCPVCERIGTYGWYFSECEFCNCQVCDDCRNSLYKDEKGKCIKPNKFFCKNCDKIKSEKEKHDNIFQLIDNLKISKKNKNTLKTYINNKIKK